MIHSLSIGIVEVKRKMRYIQSTMKLIQTWKFREFNTVGGSYVGEILEDAVFEIIDITGKIYGASDVLA